MVQQVRQAAVAGAFYPGSKEILFTEVNSLLHSAGQEKTHTSTATTAHPDRTSAESIPKAIIVPHAGYIYSGPIAASAYSRLSKASDIIKRVILLGPVHRVPVRGMALPGAEYFETPLGRIPVDQESAASIKHLPQVVVSPAVHAEEHSLEVQLPFLQSVLKSFTVLPLAVGDATPQEVAEVLELVWGGEETLIVVSSDLSHYLPYQDAQIVDAETAQHILELHSSLNHRQACGGTPVNGLLLAAKHHDLCAELLDLRNSGDTAGDKSRVVGYAAFAFNRRHAE